MIKLILIAKFALPILMLAAAPLVLAWDGVSTGKIDEIHVASARTYGVRVTLAGGGTACTAEKSCEKPCEKPSGSRLANGHKLNRCGQSRRSTVQIVSVCQT